VQIQISNLNEGRETVSPNEGQIWATAAEQAYLLQLDQLLCKHQYRAIPWTDQSTHTITLGAELSYQDESLTELTLGI
jgi:hypothetical protein